MKSSAEMRDTLSQLEIDLEKAGAALIECQAAHRTAIRRSIETGEHDAATVTESALNAAHAAHARATTARDICRTMIAEAARKELEESQASARAEIEASLAEMAVLAREADQSFAATIGKLRQLYAKETEAHRAVRSAFNAPPWQAPRALTAAEFLASFLRSLSGGNPADLKPWVEETMNSGAKNIRQALVA